MNLMNALTLGGVVLLLFNILYGIVRTARGHVRAGWFTAALAFVACALIGTGLVGQTVAASPFLPAQPPEPLRVPGCAADALR
jgi:hypothetical protein